MKQLIVVIISLQVCFSQISGTITDQNGDPLPFAEVEEYNSTNGTVTNMSGYFELDTKKETGQVQVSYLGFDKQLVSFSKNQVLKIVLKNKLLHLNELVINTNRDATAFMKLVISKNQKKYNKLESYHCKTYIKGNISIDKAPKKILGRKLDFNGMLDSTNTGILYLSESISELNYKKSNLYKEKMIASKVGGYDEFYSPNRAKDMNLSIFESTVNLNGYNITSPLSKTATSVYKFSFKGTYTQSGNTIQVIQVDPKTTSSALFSGDLFINKDNYELSESYLSISGSQMGEPGLDSISIQQEIDYTNDIPHIKEQLYKFSFSFFGVKGKGYFLGKNQDYKFNHLQKSDFDKVIFSVDESAKNTPDTQWDKLRPIQLNSLEVADYIKKDSINSLRKTKPYLDSLDLERNKVQLTDILFGHHHTNSFNKNNWGTISPLEMIFFNTVQGWNIGTGLYYQKWNNTGKLTTANAKIGYGLSNNEWNYSLGFSQRRNRINYSEYSIDYFNGIRQINTSNPISTFENTLFSTILKENYAKFIYEQKIQLGYSRYFGMVKTNASIGWNERKSVFNALRYSNASDYSTNNPLSPLINTPVIPTSYVINASVGLEYQIGQKIEKTPNRTTYLSNNNPKLHIQYTHQMDLDKSQFDFGFLELGVAQEKTFGNWGTTKYTINGGTFFKRKNQNLSFIDFKHFNGNATFLYNSNRQNAFFSLPYYLLSTQNTFVEGHFSHHFSGAIWNRLPLLKHLGLNLSAEFNILSRYGATPYLETGVGIHNIGIGKIRPLSIYLINSNTPYQNPWQVKFSIDL